MQLISASRCVWRLLTLKKLFAGQECSIVLAAMPKSGSTFLSRSLQCITGYPDHYLAQNYKNIEQELHIPSLVDGYACGTVTQQHFKANEPNITLLKTFNIRPIIVYRNISDVIMSMRDHLNNEALDNLPNLYPPASFPDMGQEKQLDFLVRHAAPWLVAFFVSWERVRKQQPVDGLYICYEDCREDWPSALKKILDFYEIPVEVNVIREKLTTMTNSGATGYRKNIGIKGRGMRALNASQIKQLRRLTLSYPEVDFSPVGL